MQSVEVFLLIVLSVGIMTVLRPQLLEFLNHVIATLKAFG